MFLFATSSNINSDGFYLFCHVFSLQSHGVCKINTHSGGGVCPLQRSASGADTVLWQWHFSIFSAASGRVLDTAILSLLFLFSFMSILLCMSFYSPSTKRQGTCLIQTGAVFVIQDIVHLTVLLTLFQLWRHCRFLFLPAVPLKILSSWELVTCCCTVMPNEKKYCSPLF